MDLGATDPPRVYCTAKQWNTLQQEREMSCWLYNKMGDPQNHYVESRKQDPKMCIMYNPIHLKF
jgi:hypothetical protein